MENSPFPTSQMPFTFLDQGSQMCKEITKNIKTLNIMVAIIIQYADFNIYTFGLSTKLLPNILTFSVI